MRRVERCKERQSEEGRRMEPRSKKKKKRKKDVVYYRCGIAVVKPMALLTTLETSDLSELHC